MSYTSQKTRPNAASMAAAVGFNGAIIIAVMLSPIVAKILPERRPTIAENLWLPIDPPPKPKLDPKQSEIPATSHVAQTDREFIIPTQISDPIEPYTPTFTGTELASSGASEDFHDLIKPIDPPKPIFKAAVRDSRYAKSFQPDFPVGLLQREIEGSAQVKVLIGIDGRVREAIVISATDPEFGRATVKKALASWHFTPATRGGEPVEDWQVLTVRFDIN